MWTLVAQPSPSSFLHLVNTQSFSGGIWSNLFKKQTSIQTMNKQCFKHSLVSSSDFFSSDLPSVQMDKRKKKQRNSPILWFTPGGVAELFYHIRFYSLLTGFHGPPTLSLLRFWTSSSEAPILPWWSGEGQRPTQAPSHWHHSCLSAQTTRGSTGQTGGQVLYPEVPVSEAKTRQWPFCFEILFF